MMIVNPISNKTLVKALIESTNSEVKKKEAEEKKQLQEASESLTVLGESVLGVQARRRKTQDKYNSFIESVKSILLQECIYKVFSEAVDPKVMAEENSDVIARNMISSFIQENGVREILSKMRYSSLTNSSLVSLIESTVKKIREAVDMTDPNTLVMDTTIKDDFFENLNLEDTGDVSDMISQRVMASIDDFIKSNSNDREKIKEILTDAKEKIDQVKANEDKDDETKTEIAESYDHIAKRHITNIRNRKQNVFNVMVSEMCKNAMKNDDLKCEFVTEGKINVPKVVSRVSLMYTFLETVNTMKLADVNEAYLDEVIASLSL